MWRLALVTKWLVWRSMAWVHLLPWVILEQSRWHVHWKRRCAVSLSAIWTWYLMLLITMLILCFLKMVMIFKPSACVKWNKSRNAWQRPGWLTCSCAVGITWFIWLNQATWTLGRLLNSSREVGSNDCLVQILQQHKKSATVAISSSFFTIHILIADAEWIKSICSVATRVGLLLLGVTVPGPPRLQRPGWATAYATGSVALPG